MTAMGNRCTNREAEQAVLGLNTAMSGIYAGARPSRSEDLLARFPVVLALFDGAGGRMLLHRPGLPVEEAPPVPVVYQYLKALAHSAVAVHEIALRDDADSAAPAGFADTVEQGLTTLPDLSLDPQAAGAATAVLAAVRAFLSTPRTPGSATTEELEDFGRSCAPHVVTLMEKAAAVQVTHWMSVLDQWHILLGPSGFDSVHAAVNTLYVTRRKNILFTVLAQYLGEQAIGDRLLLFETPEFTTTPEQMLDLMTRVVADRDLGRAFFGHGQVMDVEILGDAAVHAIRTRMRQRGKTPVLPTWPPTTPTSGPGPPTRPAGPPPQTSTPPPLSTSPALPRTDTSRARDRPGRRPSPEQIREVGMSAPPATRHRPQELLRATSSLPASLGGLRRPLPPTSARIRNDDLKLRRFESGTDRKSVV